MTIVSVEKAGKTIAGKTELRIESKKEIKIKREDFNPRFSFIPIRTLPKYLMFSDRILHRTDPAHLVVHRSID
jgi:hypothetical protein